MAQNLKQIKSTVTLMNGATDLEADRFVTLSSGVLAYATSGTPIGVTQFPVKKNVAGNVILEGVVYVTASAAIALGANVSATTDGKAVTATTGESATTAVGICLNAPAAAGDTAVILLTL